MTEAHKVTRADAAKAVNSALGCAGSVIRITPGQRRAILSKTASKATRSK